MHFSTFRSPKKEEMAGVPGEGHSDGTPAPSGGRWRVDGKYFARGNERVRSRGVTYGPFAPTAEGQPFAAPAQVVEDFARMRAGALNTIRTYHLPPEWLLQLAEEMALGVFLDIPWPKHLCFLESRQAQSDARSAVR